MPVINYYFRKESNAEKDYFLASERYLQVSNQRNIACNAIKEKSPIFLANSKPKSNEEIKLSPQKYYTFKNQSSRGNRRKNKSKTKSYDQNPKLFFTERSECYNGPDKAKINDYFYSKKGSSEKNNSFKSNSIYPNKNQIAKNNAASNNKKFQIQYTTKFFFKEKLKQLINAGKNESLILFKKFQNDAQIRAEIEERASRFSFLPNKTSSNQESKNKLHLNSSQSSQSKTYESLKDSAAKFSFLAAGNNKIKEDDQSDSLNVFHNSNEEEKQNKKDTSSSANIKNLEKGAKQNSSKNIRDNSEVIDSKHLEFKLEEEENRLLNAANAFEFNVNPITHSTDFLTNSDLYSKLEDLTPEEVQEFKAPIFSPDKIPNHPPPKELCK